MRILVLIDLEAADDCDPQFKGPKTQEEFMEVIIKENAVQLPDLPEGDVYYYDPQTEQLMVRHPAPQ